MKVWVVLEYVYDLDSGYTHVAAVFDSEEKANNYKLAQEVDYKKFKTDVEKCRSCPLIESIDDYLYQCYSNKVMPNISVIRQKENDCKANCCPHCNIELSYFEEEIVDYAICRHAEDLYIQDMHSHLYEVIPMEVQ